MLSKLNVGFGLGSHQKEGGLALQGVVSQVRADTGGGQTRVGCGPLGGEPLGTHDPGRVLLPPSDSGASRDRAPRGLPRRRV